MTYEEEEEPSINSSLAIENEKTSETEKKEPPV